MKVLIVLVPVGFAAYGGYIYYHLLWLHVQSKQALQHVDDQLTRHHETIPHLLLTLSDYIHQEAWIIEHVMEARYRSLSARSTHERMIASSHLSEALQHLFRISEACSGYHCDDEVAIIHSQVMMGEQKIAVAREYYNHIVQHYNEQISRFPHCVFAQIGGLRRESLFPDRHLEFVGAGVDAQFG